MILDEYMTPELDYLKFGQLLAKIAYSYTCSRYKVTEFTLDKVPIIKGVEMNIVRFIKNAFREGELDMSCFSYIGSSARSLERSSHLHELGFGTIHSGEARFDVVYIRLFANLGAPLHMVVMNYTI
jgi:hypothetical protein